MKRLDPVFGRKSQLGDYKPVQELNLLIYAVGDIHGRYDLLRLLLAELVADSRARAPERPPQLIFCGDYIDRGPDSAKVLEALVQLCALADFDVRLLKGNHEQALLEFIEDPTEGAPWIDYGGAQTLRSYGLKVSDSNNNEALWRLRDQLLGAMPASHLRLLQQLHLIHVLEDYAFVHAGVRPNIPFDAQIEDDLLWIRQDFLEAKGPFEKVIIHGHTWVGDQPTRTSHRIGIDTGAYATGVLTAVRLDRGDVGFLQAKASATASLAPASGALPSSPKRYSPPVEQARASTISSKPP